MSGIVGLVQFDGSPVQSGLLRKLTEFLAFRGPDNQRIWIKDKIGFGHTLFKTTEESERDSQPLSLDGKTWIVADARIDARQELFAALKAAGEPDIDQSSWTDAELILRAYRVWGVDCVEHLLGDFAFGIWDDSRQQLFCARDHMGVKPFYYAQAGSCVIFSNTLDCIRRHPLVSNRLNDLAIADFLLFGFNHDSATTSFAEVQRLPPAHRAICSQNGVHLYRYWSMPIDEPLFLRRPGDYIEQFRALLREAVGDRLRTNKASIFLSGGLDSGTLAAAAGDRMREHHPHFQLRAITQVNSFVPDEPRYARMTAGLLGIPITYDHWERVGSFDWERIAFSLPEPYLDACLIPSERQFWKQSSCQDRVYLYGEGPDNALMLDWRPYLSYLVRHGRYGLLLRSAVSTVLSEKRPPFWGRISNWANRGSYLAHNTKPAYPVWLNPEFETRLQLRERWGAASSAATPNHPIRPTGYASLQNPLWQCLFERLDAGVTQASFEVRQPFVDIRMLRFLLAIPPLPWCRSKYLLRRAMRGSLPAEVLHRRKAAIDVRPLRNFLAKFCASPFLPSVEILGFIDPQHLPTEPVQDEIEGNLRVRTLNHWLQNFDRPSHNFQEGGVCARFVRQTAPIA